MGRIPMMNPNMPGPLPGGMPPGMGRMPMGPMSMGPMPGYPMGPIGHMGPMGPMNPMMAPGINPMSMLNPADLVAKRREFLKDKDNINKDATIVKKVAIGYIITDLESLGMKESRRLADIIIKGEDVKSIYNLLENIEDLKKKALSIRLDDKEARQ